MELRAYWQIIWRRRRLIIPLVIVTVIASAIANLVLPPVYKTETTVHVQAILPPPAANPYFSEEYYRTIHSEYLTDDLGVIVKTRVFAERVAAQIHSRFGQEVGVQDVLDSITTTKKLHRTLKITIATGTYGMTQRIADAMDDVLQRDAANLLTRDDRQVVNVNVVDPPRDPTSPSVLRRLLDVLLHGAVALIVGTGIAFLLHAMDDRIQGESDAVQATGWPAIGVIPLDPANEAAPELMPVTRWLGGVLRPLRLARRQATNGAARSGRSLRNMPARRPSRVRGGPQRGL